MVKKQNVVIQLHTVKIDDIYIDIAEDVEARFDTLNYESEGPLSKGKNKKVINEG